VKFPTFGRHEHTEAESLTSLIEQLGNCIAWLEASRAIVARYPALAFMPHRLAVRHLDAAADTLRQAVAALHVVTQEAADLEALSNATAH
jgi:hypothetical protein